MRMDRARAWTMAALCWAGTALAAGPGGAQKVPTADEAYASIEARKTVAYRDALAQFDAAQRLAPRDAALAVGRCEFIGYFADEDYDWIETASDEYDACVADLSKRLPDAPEVALFELDYVLGEDDALARAEALLPKSKSWPAPLRARLLAKLSASLPATDQARAGDYALQAAKLGDASELPTAVRHLVREKKFDAAMTLLESTPPTDDGSQASARVRVAMELPDTFAPRRVLHAHEHAGVQVFAKDAVAACLRANDVACARKAMDDLDEDAAWVKPLQFDIAMAARDYAGAAKTIDLTDTDDLGPTFSRFTRLATASPASLLQGQMPFMLFGVLVMLVALALLPGLLLVPVHYRGLVRRLQHRMPQSSFPRLRLWHAWLGGAVALVVPTAISLVFASRTGKGFDESALTDPVVLLNTVLWGSVLGLLCISPTFEVFGRRGLLGDAAVWRTHWKRILIYLVGLYALSTFIAGWHHVFGGGADTKQIEMVHAIASGASGGKTSILLTLLGIAVIGPVFEELTFRGLLLGGFARHLSFGWANGLQAFAFACMHGDPPRFLFYFAMGLLTGTLVRKTGSLAPAIALHMLNNAVSMSLLMWLL